MPRLEVWRILLILGFLFRNLEKKLDNYHGGGGILLLKKNKILALSLDSLSGKWAVLVHFSNTTK